MASPGDEARLQNARDTIDSLYDLSQLLHTGTSTRLRVPSEQVAIMLKRSGLDKQTLSICVGMIEAGANPDTLAAVVKELRRESESLSSTRA